jgi:hypothetical protein
LSYARLLDPGAFGGLAVRFRTPEIGSLAGGVNASLPSVVGSNPGTRAVSLAFHRHALLSRAQVLGVRLGVITVPNPATIRIKAALYEADEATGLPSSPIPGMASADVAFSANTATAGDRYLDLLFPAAVAGGRPRPLWVALMCETFYTASDTTLGSLRGSFVRTAVCGSGGTLFDQDLAYIGAGDSTIASPFPSGIAAAGNFAQSADGALANAACGLICV